MFHIFNKSDLDLITDYVVPTIPYSEKGREVARQEIAEACRPIFQRVISINMQNIQHLLHFEEDRSLRDEQVFSYEILQREHIQKSHDQMLAAARASLSTDHVCIIGPGLLEKEIMPNLAHHFSRISLIGASMTCLIDCAQAVPSHLQRPIDLICCDLTGCFQKTRDFLQDLYREGVSFDTAIELLNLYLVNELHCLNEQIPSIAKADYVVSSLIMSQLPSSYIDFFQSELQEYWPLDMEDNADRRLFTKNILKLFQFKHLRFLDKITKDKGCIYLSDTVELSYRSGPFENFCCVRDVFKIMANLFNIDSRDSWQWHSTHEYSWIVEQYILKKKITSKL